MQAGDIVMVRFDLETGDYKNRPCLVLAVNQRLGKATTLLVARGTSQRVGRVQPWDFIVRLEDGKSIWEASGLNRPTVFSMELVREVRDTEVRRIGHLHAGLYARLEKAMQQGYKRGWLTH